MNPLASPVSESNEVSAPSPEQATIQNMMGAICFIPKYSQQRQYNNADQSKDQIVSSSNDLPYNHIFNKSALDELWAELIKDFNNLFCVIHKINQSNPLFMLAVASAYSLPKYLAAHKALGLGNSTTGIGGASQLVGGFNSKEMACEVDLGPDFTYHNIFICPVSKEISNPHGNNPMLLKCGHVISKHSLNKMTR